jgi:hypothetical protein
MRLSWLLGIAVQTAPERAFCVLSESAQQAVREVRDNPVALRSGR